MLSYLSNYFVGDRVAQPLTYFGYLNGWLLSGLGRSFVGWFASLFVSLSFGYFVGWLVNQSVIMLYTWLVIEFVI